MIAMWLKTLMFWKYKHMYVQIGKGKAYIVAPANEIDSFFVEIKQTLMKLQELGLEKLKEKEQL